MEIKRPVGRPRKTEQVEEITKDVNRTITQSKPRPKPRYELDGIHDRLTQIEFVLLGLAEAIQREDYDNVVHEVKRLLKI